MMLAGLVYMLFMIPLAYLPGCIVWLGWRRSGHRRSKRWIWGLGHTQMFVYFGGLIFVQPFIIKYGLRNLSDLLSLLHLGFLVSTWFLLLLFLSSRGLSKLDLLRESPRNK